MNIWLILIEGIGATLLMTAFVYGTSYVIKQRIKVVKILGTMLTGSTTRDKGLSNKDHVLIIGMVGHYLVGIFFSAIYNWLWYHNIIAFNLNYCLLTGFLLGIIAMIIWKLFFYIHPNPPLIPLKLYLIVIFMAHLVFGEGIYLTRWLFG